MIDAHAKSELTAGIENRMFGGAHLTQEAVDVLKHALVALADRKALVEAWQAGDRLEGGKRDSPALHAARRHMRGEE